MAYLRDIATQCSGYQLTCRSRAAVVLVDRWNGERGRYCRKCGARALKAMQAAETVNVPSGKVELPSLVDDDDIAGSNGF